MSQFKSTTVEVRLPSRMGFEKVAMSTAASVAKLMGFRDDRIEDLKTAVLRGATMAANGSGLQWSTIRSIAMAWVLTLPAAMLISGTLYFILRQFV